MLTLAYFLNGILFGFIAVFCVDTGVKFKELLWLATLTVVGSFIGYLIFSSWVLIVKSLI